MMLSVVKHDHDQKEHLLNVVGDISGIELFHNQVLVAIYIRPDRTKAGLYLPDQTKTEDRFQSKVGLVLLTGPASFKDDSQAQFHGVAVQRGDWVVFRASDGWESTINGTPCRMLADVNVRGRVTSPELVF